MNDKVKKILPLVGATALTASALVAGTGATLAGKADATIGLNASGCSDSGGDWRYFMTVNLNDNKGKWIFIEASLESDGMAPQSKPSHRVQTGFEQLVFTGNGAPATMTVTVTTRKGESTDVSVSRDLACPAP